MTQSKHNSKAGFRNSEDNRLREESDSDRNKEGILNHMKAAEHFILAAEYHQEAARYHEEGNHTKACESTLIAIGHASLANHYQAIDAEMHALEE